jgi:hypothetical protein
MNGPVPSRSAFGHHARHQMNPLGSMSFCPTTVESRFPQTGARSSSDSRRYAHGTSATSD